LGSVWITPHIGPTFFAQRENSITTQNQQAWKDAQADEHVGDAGAVAGALSGFCLLRYVRFWG
jgi:hypothetical protein